MFNFQRKSFKTETKKSCGICRYILLDVWYRYFDRNTEALGFQKSTESGLPSEIKKDTSSGKNAAIYSKHQDKRTIEMLKTLIVVRKWQ